MKINLYLKLIAFIVAIFSKNLFADELVALVNLKYPTLVPRDCEADMRGARFEGGELRPMGNSMAFSNSCGIQIRSYEVRLNFRSSGGVSELRIEQPLGENCIAVGFSGYPSIVKIVTVGRLLLLIRLMLSMARNPMVIMFMLTMWWQVVAIFLWVKRWSLSLRNQ